MAVSELFFIRRSKCRNRDMHPPTGISIHLKTLGERLRYQRRQMGWTQEQLAQNAGTNQAVIQKIENGKSLRPRKIDTIASVLNVNPAWLMFGDANPELSEEAKEVGLAWQKLSPQAQNKIKNDIYRLSESHH